MPAVNQKGSHVASSLSLHTLMHFCRTVVHHEERQLQLAMLEYEQVLFEQAQPAGQAA